MAKFLTTQRAEAEIEDIINRAKNYLILISPYIQIPEPLLQTLRSADRRGVKIALVYGKGELHQNERIKLEQLNNLSLLFLENLHAKCYFNEQNMVITSLNLFEASGKNREMGILINVGDDQGVFEEAADEAKVIIESSTKVDLRTPQEVNTGSQSVPPQGAYFEHLYCIRCRQPIPPDPDKPLCRACYDVWKQWEDPEYPENYCLLCGKNEETSMLKPLCRSCYSEAVTYKKSH